MAGIVAVLLLASVGCGSSPLEVENPQVISYAGAAGRLQGMESTEAEEQLRDWARTGLASLLELDTARFRDAMYDTVPVRDPAFVDLAEQPTGPGRALFDGQVLHLLVPQGDTYEDRTVGLLIDDHRADAGSDPRQVRIHHYQINRESQTIRLTSDDAAPAAEVRSAHGYVEMRIDESPKLAEFLAQVQHLSWLEARGTEIWAGGWRWPGTPGAHLDSEDISVLQRGYLAFDQQGYLYPDSVRLPGFSLDPGPPESPEDIRVLLPDLAPALADQLIADQWEGPLAEQVAVVVEEGLFGDPPPELLAQAGLPSDRTQLWALLGRLDGVSMYSQARYEGGLKGTEVGMTLFYADLVAKDWTSGVGSGVPAKAVGGFVPDSKAVTPWSHCPAEGDPTSEYGRLWFGQNESGFAFDEDGVSIGAQATRLFARSDAEGGTEVEPSYSFGRGLRWWDRHYQQIADYEQQYHRLDQIMRWSGALEWLVTRTDVQLPQADDSGIRSDLRFEQWYGANNDLRERSKIKFVRPPSAIEESLLAKPSDTAESCGLPFITGGVSLGDLIQRRGDRSYQAELPLPVRRAGPVDEASTFDPATGTGTITRLSIDENGQVADTLTRTFSQTPGGPAAVDVVGDGRRVAPFGDLKIVRADTAQRQIRVELAADRGELTQRVGLQGQPVGELVTHKEANTVTVQWKAGPLDHLRRALESIQDRMRPSAPTDVPTPTDGVLYSLQDATGRTVHKIGGTDAPWLSITRDPPPPPGDNLAFRLGVPDPGSGLPTFLQATLTALPDMRHGGQRAQWMDVVPANADHPATAAGADPPSPRAKTVTVSTPDGTTTSISPGDGGHPRVRVDDPLLGPNGPAEGAALLRDAPRVVETMRRAATAQDGLFRGVALGEDGVALAGADRVIIAAADHPWAERVQRAIDPRHPDRQPLMRIDGSRAVHVDPGELTVPPGSQRMSLAEALGSTDHAVYLHRSMLVFEDGAIVTDALQRDTQVIVRPATPAEPASAQSTAWQPDVRTHQGAEWERITNGAGGERAAGNSVGGIVPNSGGNASAVPSPPMGGQILLVCPDEESDLVGCEQ